MRSATNFRIQGLVVTLVCIVATSAARGGVIRPIGIEVFSDASIVESFEGLTPGENIELVPASELYFEDGERRTGADGDGFLRPGVSGPFVFGSGIQMTNPIPNTFESGGGVYIGDFTIGDATFFGVRSPMIDSADQVPDGTAYLANEGNELRFVFPYRMRRFGLIPSRPVLGIRLLDDDGEILIEARVSRINLQEPFLGIEYEEPFRAVEFFSLGGPRVVGSDRYVIDSVIADPIPEPASFLLLSLGMASASCCRPSRRDQLVATVLAVKWIG